MSGTADWSPPLRISLNVLKCKRQRSLVVCQDTVIGGLSLGPSALPRVAFTGVPPHPSRAGPATPSCPLSPPLGPGPSLCSQFPKAGRQLWIRSPMGDTASGVQGGRVGCPASWGGARPGARLPGSQGRCGAQVVGEGPGFWTGTPPGKGSQRPALLGPSHTGCRPRWEAPPPRRLVEPAAQAVALEREGGDHGRGEGCCFSRAPGEGERQRVPSTTSEEDDTP